MPAGYRCKAWLVWCRRLIGFATADGVVFATGQTGVRYDPGLTVEALHASDGAHLWRNVVLSSGSGGSEPFLANGMIYVFGTSDNLYALRAGDGQMVGTSR